MPYDISEAFQAIEEDMIASMARNLGRHLETEKEEGLNYTMWQAEQLAALKEYRNRNKKRFGEYFSTINSQIEDVLKRAHQSGKMDQEVKILEAIKRGWSTLEKPSKELQGAFFKINDRKLNALLDSVKSDMQKAETAMLRRVDDEYRKILFNSQVYYNTGVGTLSKCLDMATRDFLARGITCIEYANGARVSIDSYAKMALRTAQTRAYLLGESAKRDEWGVNTVIVNRRGVACPKCLKFVGKIFYDDVWGSTPIPSPAKYPRLSEAVAKGLYHPNCKDIHTTYFEGISTPPKPMTKEEENEAGRIYELEQRQRYIERQIRKYKRLSSGSFDPENAERYKKKVGEWQKQEIALLKTNGDVLKRNYDNEKIFDIPAIDNTDIRRTIRAMHREVEEEARKAAEQLKTIDFSEKDAKLKARGINFKHLKGKHTIEDDIGTRKRPICNPKFKTGGEYANNCGYCSAAYEMRRRGYDVIANPKNTMSVHEWEKLFIGSAPVKTSSATSSDLVAELQEKLSALGDGARGSLLVFWNNKRVGHFFSWEIEKGIVRFIDAQSGETNVARYFDLVQPSKTVYIRWDDLEPSDMIKNTCKNKGGRKNDRKRST